MRSLSGEGVSVQAVSDQGGVSVKGKSLSRGISVQGGLCLGVSVQREGLCPEGSLSIEGLCQGDPPRAVKSGQHVFYWNESLSNDSWLEISFVIE